jgi:hypothetical protein
MPWKECNVVEEHMRFIGRLLDGETARPEGGRIPKIHEVDPTRHPEPLPDQAETTPATWLTDSFGPGSRMQRPVSVPRNLQTRKNFLSFRKNQALEDDCVELCSLRIGKLQSGNCASSV